MPAMKTVEALFEHELKDVYDAESKLVDALKQQASESKTPEIRKAFETHREETQEQVRRVEKVFEILGKEASRGSGCMGMEGLLEEHKSFTGEDPSPEILDTFNLVAAAKVERYEITAYESLVMMAEELGLDDAVNLLQQNLQEERNTLEKVQKLMRNEKPLQNVKKEA